MSRYDHKSMSWRSAAEMGADAFKLSAPTSHREIAYVRRHPITGRQPTAFFTHLDRLGSFASGSGHGASTSGGSKSNQQQNHPHAAAGFGAGALPFGVGAMNDGKAGDFVCYSDSDDSDDDVSGHHASKWSETGDRISINFADCITSRELGLNHVGGGKFFSGRLSSEYGTRHMIANSMLKETPVPVPHMNKVFCSQWLSHRQVVFGTKCNKLMVYDVNSRFMDQIPSLRSSENRVPPGQECGIHAIEINPSGTLLATGAKYANDVAVYRLPTLDPICVGEGAHSDWIFDLTWLDDQFLVSGSRDGTIALWRITDEQIDQVTSSEIPSYLYTRALLRKPCKTADKVRAMCFNTRLSELAVISTNGFIHCWDGLRMRQQMSKRLPHNKENVCLSVNDENNLYAVGSRQHTDLLDARTLQAVKKISSRNSCYGVRSVSFKGNILTIGTAMGILFFWDVRAGKFLESTMNTNRAVTLKASPGWWDLNDYPIQHLDPNTREHLPAIYTHCYDQSGTRLFAAGGPLAVDLKGNFVALFQ